jgi:hypothetical protein
MGTFVALHATMAFRVEWLVPHLISLIVAVVMAFAAWKRPPIGRLLYVLLFAYAAQLNVRMALATPEIYLDYARLTEWAAMRKIIVGPFAAHVQAYVTLIAIGQAFIAVGLCLRGALARTAAVFAILFLVSIAPLGVGSAFPATLIMAGGAFVLLRGGLATSLLHDLKTTVRPLRHARG